MSWHARRVVGTGLRQDVPPLKNSPPMRISILGNSGPGKSTLARWLSDRLAAPWLDLASMAWVKGKVAMAQPIDASLHLASTDCVRPMRLLLHLCLLVGLAACRSGPPPVVPPAEPEIQLLGDRLVFAGHITKASARLFAQHVQSASISTLVIGSPGGDVDAALDIAEIVFQRGMHVEVQVICASSCANYIFPAGKRKTITPGAIVGWHGNVAHLAYLDREDPRRSSELIRQATLQTARREAAFFKAIGVDGFICWFAKLPPYNVRGTYALSRRDMEHFGLRDIQALETYASTDLSPLHASGTERFEFVTVDRTGIEALRPQGFE